MAPCLSGGPLRTVSRPGPPRGRLDPPDTGSAATVAISMSRATGTGGNLPLAAASKGAADVVDVVDGARKRWRIRGCAPLFAFWG